MKNLTKFWRITAMGAVILAGVIFITGCATTVPIKSVRQPTIPTGDVQRMAIKPFENKGGGSVGTQLAQHLSDRTGQIIRNSNKFTIVAPTDPNAEGIFSGEIRSITSNDSQSQSQRKDKEGNVTIVTTYRRDVSVTFAYQVISTRTGMALGEVVKQDSTSTTSSDMSSLTDTLSLAKRIVDYQLRQFERDIVPTIVSTSRKLMDETSKDKVVKQLMKEAKALVKNSHYEEAIKEYDRIASEHGSSAARANANILREAIDSDIAARAEMAALFEDKGGLAEKAVKNAIASIGSKLQDGSNIIVMKTNSADRDRTDFVVDQMTKNFVQEGRLKVVDRTNRDLINAEAAYQASGNVSDDSYVSIGKQLGAQYIVLCWISGEMSSRRLNVKVLNIETAQITDQNDFEI